MKSGRVRIRGRGDAPTTPKIRHLPPVCPARAHVLPLVSRAAARPLTQTCPTLKTGLNQAATAPPAGTRRTCVRPTWADPCTTSPGPRDGGRHAAHRRPPADVLRRRPRRYRPPAFWRLPAPPTSPDVTQPDDAAGPGRRAPDARFSPSSPSWNPKEAEGLSPHDSMTSPLPVRSRPPNPVAFGPNAPWHDTAAAARGHSATIAPWRSSPAPPRRRRARAILGMVYNPARSCAERRRLSWERS